MLARTNATEVDLFIVSDGNGYTVEEITSHLRQLQNRIIVEGWFLHADYAETVGRITTFSVVARKGIRYN